MTDSNHITEVLSDQKEAELLENFNAIDTNGNGFIEDFELHYALEVVGFKKASFEVRDLMEKYDVRHKDGRIDFEEFKVMYADLQKQEFGFKLKDVVRPREGVEDYETETSKHSVRREEQVAFSDWMNRSLTEDAQCTKYLPLHPEGRDLAEKCKDGVLICKVINRCKSGTIDERVINFGERLSLFQKHENIELALNSARAIGCNVVNIGAGDIENGVLHLLLGLLWQVIKVGLLSEVNIMAHSELARLATEEETLAMLRQSSPEALLMRWVNHHLKAAGCERQVKNLTSDIKDSEVYAYLLQQIAPADKKATLQPVKSIISTTGYLSRAELVLKNAERINARVFVTPTDIVTGNRHLNLAFVANLFNTYSGLDMLDAEGLDAFGEAGDEEDGVPIFEETREERTYRNWMNSMGLSPVVNYLYSDLKDGLVFFQLYNIIRPNSVDSKRVRSTFKKISAHMEKLENCNYAVELGLQFGFSLVGVGGEDLYSGNRTLTLALVWQLMRAYTLAILQQLTKTKKAVSERDIIEWANRKLQAGGKEARITSFNDAFLADGRAIIDLISVISPDAVNMAMVKKSRSEQDCIANANYAISCARKIGANVYALPEDITEVKPKMIMTIFACLMVVDNKRENR